MKAKTSPPNLQRPNSTSRLSSSVYTNWAGALAQLLALSAVLPAQDPPVIHVPVRLVTVPTLAASKQGKYISGLTAANFRLTDNGKEKAFTLDPYTASLSVVVAVQINGNVRSYTLSSHESAVLSTMR